MKNKIYTDLALLLLRVSFGFSIIFGHGWKKLIALFTERPISFSDPLGIGESLSLGLVVFAEVLCGALLIIGFKSRLASIPLIFTMLVVTIFVKWGDPFNKIELPFLFLVGFLCILLMGPGKYSVDGMLKQAK
jgi:putative oxidoreductase